MEMEIMYHFSHEEHPLILNQLPNKTDDCDPVLCYGCQKPILEVEAYSCLPCQFFLHKRCAELPKQITHSMHPIHPLVLHKNPPYSTGFCTCNACCIRPWRFFTYNCFTCEFDIHVSCAILDRSFEHDSHEHPLISLRRRAIFTCNACFTRDEDSSYVCSICPFWIHETCASLPKIMDYKNHKHPLSLAYSIPMEHRNFYKFCVVCRQQTHPGLWCYYCGPCRYFIHLKCLASETESTEGIPILEGEPDCNLPSPQAAQELIKHFFLAGNESDNQIEEVISDFVGHKAHPLTLCSINLQTQQNEAMIGKKVICDCCIEPVSNLELCYSCVDCGYFIHPTCARLPAKIQILNHSEHPLHLARRSYLGFSRCSACGRPSNGLSYECEPCGLCVCIKCTIVSLAKTAVHSAHEQHLLTNQAVNFNNSNWNKCDACGEGRTTCFGCDKCKFYLCSECFFLPASIKQIWQWHDHPFFLIYGAYYEHPDDFYCVMCELEINPNHWMYHCRECDYSFHVWCIPQIRLFRNVKFGRTFRVDNHPHPLTHVPEAKHKSFCEDCSERLDWKQALECDPCKFYLCLPCGLKRELRPTDIVNPTDDDHSSQPDDGDHSLQSDDGKELMLAVHTEQHVSTVSSSRWRALKQKLIITRLS